MKLIIAVLLILAFCAIFVFISCTSQEADAEISSDEADNNEQTQPINLKTIWIFLGPHAQRCVSQLNDLLK